MSIVVAVKKENRIAVAGDTRTGFGEMIVPMENHNAPKIRRVGSSYIAATGWAIYENIFDDYLRTKKVPVLTNKANIYKFFRRLWRVLHSDYGFVNDQANDKDSPFGDLDASFLIVNRSGIFYVASDMSVTAFEKYYGIGSGNDFALGALFALYQDGYSAADLAVKACEAAIAFNPYCGGKVDLFRVK